MADDDDTEDRYPHAAPHASGQRRREPPRLERRALNPAQERKAVRWAKKRGLSEEYGKLYHSLPLSLKHWDATDLRAVVHALMSHSMELTLLLMEKVEKLEAELAQHEFQGPWDQSRAYRKHNSVNCGGHLWICKADSTQSKPGTDPDAWQLAVRRGRDARAWDSR